MSFIVLLIHTLHFTKPNFLIDMEQMAKEQDRETDKQAILSETEGHRKQTLRLEKQL